VRARGELRDRSCRCKSHPAPQPLHFDAVVLVRHVDDLHAAVDFRRRVAGILELVLPYPTVTRSERRCRTCPSDNA